MWYVLFVLRNAFPDPNNETEGKGNGVKKSGGVCLDLGANEKPKGCSTDVWKESLSTCGFVHSCFAMQWCELHPPNSNH